MRLFEDRGSDDKGADHDDGLMGRDHHFTQIASVPKIASSSRQQQKQ